MLTKKFTSNDSDIIISKAKAASGRKTSRKLDFDEFIHCVELIAAQKAVDPEKIYTKLLASQYNIPTPLPSIQNALRGWSVPPSSCRRVCSCSCSCSLSSSSAFCPADTLAYIYIYIHLCMGTFVGSAEPALARTQPKAPSDVTARLTDTSQYTGAHKLRFDEEGNGKGLAGRDSAKKGGGHIPAFAVTGKRGAAGGGSGGAGAGATLADDLDAVDLDPITLQEAFTQYALFGASRVQTTVELSTSASQGAHLSAPACACGQVH